MNKSKASFLKANSFPSSRKLKVHYAYYGNGFNNNYPVIRIAGKYLRSFGFEIGSILRVDLKVDRITITRIINS